MTDLVLRALALLKEELAELEQRVAALEGEQPESPPTPPTRLEQIQTLLRREK